MSLTTARVYKMSCSFSTTSTHPTLRHNITPYIIPFSTHKITAFRTTVRDSFALASATCATNKNRLSGQHQFNHNHYQNFWIPTLANQNHYPFKLTPLSTALSPKSNTKILIIPRRTVCGNGSHASSMAGGRLTMPYQISLQRTLAYNTTTTTHH